MVNDKYNLVKFDAFSLIHCIRPRPKVISVKIDLFIKHMAKMCVLFIQCTDLSLDDVMDYDATCFISKYHSYRREFLRRWFQIKPGASYAALDTNGKIVGYACRRFMRNGLDPSQVASAIGPLYADNMDIAEALLKRHLQDVVGEGIEMSTL